jgi:VCBS repeat-containing protein
MLYLHGLSGRAYNWVRAASVFFSCFVLVTWAAAQSCSVSVSTNPPSPVQSNQSVSVNATLTVDGIQTLGSTRFAPAGGSATAEVDLDGAPICSSFTDSCSTNVGPLSVGTHSLAWSCSGLGINANSGSQLLEVTSGSGSGPQQGFLPKFLVLSILYPPPGNQSSVSFTDTVSTSLTASITNTFVAGTSLKFTLGPPIPPRPSPTPSPFPVSPTFGITASTTSSESFTLSVAGSQGSQVSSHVDFVDHYQDVFYIWLNPLVIVTQTGPNAGTFTITTPVGPNGQREPMDVLPFSVADLLNPDQIPLAKMQPIPIGGGFTVPGLSSICANPAKCTAADFANILRLDPLIFPFGSSDPNTSPAFANSDPAHPRFLQIQTPEFLFLDPSVRNTFSVTDSGSTVVSVGSSVQTSVGFSFSDTFGNIQTGIVPNFSLQLQDTTTFTFTEAVSLAVSTTISHQQQATLATISQGCFEDMNVFEDVLFHSFVLVPPGPSPAACGMPEADFQLLTNPSFEAVPAGATASYGVSTLGEFGFNNTESLSVTGLPPGGFATFSPSAVIQTTGTATLNISTSNTTPGDYNLTITGSGAGIMHKTNVLLRVSDFAVSAVTPLQTVTPNQAAIYTINVGSLNFFSSDVTMSITSGGGLPSGTTVSFNPPVVNGLAFQSTIPVVLTVPIPDTTPPGSYTLTVTGSSGGISHSTNIVVNVVAFSLAATPASQTVVASGSTSYTVSASALNGFTGNVALSVSGLPPSTSASFAPSSLNSSGSSILNIVTSSTTPAGTYTLTISGTSGSLIRAVAVTLNVQNFTLSATPASQFVPSSGGCATVTTNIVAQNGFNNPVTLSVSNLPPGTNPAPSFSVNPVTGSGTSTLLVCTTSSTPAGSYTPTITGSSGSLTQTTTVNIVVGIDFQVSIAPTSQTVTAGGSTSYTVTITPVNGFSGVVSLSVSNLPAGAMGNFSPSTVSGSGSSTLTISTASSTPSGNYPLITITGASGTLSHIANVTLNVIPPPPGDFSISASPASLTVQQGASVVDTITITSQNGFSGNVNVSVSGAPDFGSASFSPAAVPVTTTQSGNSALGIFTSTDTPTGIYTLTITGTAASGLPSHSLTIRLSVVLPRPCRTISCTPLQ